MAFLNGRGRFMASAACKILFIMTVKFCIFIVQILV